MQLIRRIVTRSHSVDNSFCKRLWTCCKTDKRKNEWMNEWIAYILVVKHTLPVIFPHLAQDLFCHVMCLQSLSSQLTYGQTLADLTQQLRSGKSCAKSNFAHVEIYYTYGQSYITDSSLNRNLERTEARQAAARTPRRLLPPSDVLSPASSHWTFIPARQNWAFISQMKLF